MGTEAEPRAGLPYSLIRANNFFFYFAFYIIIDLREQYVDARSAGRFEGTEAEPRAGLRGGHIPRSKNVFTGEVLDIPHGCALVPCFTSSHYVSGAPQQA